MDKDQLYKIKIDKPDACIYAKAKARFDSIAKPIDALGDFEDIICDIAAMTGNEKPDISKKALIIMCADNGVVEEGVTQTEASVTASVARLMGRNASSVGIMTKGYPVKTVPVDIGIDTDEKLEGVLDKKIAKGSGNIKKAAAMTNEQCLAAIEAGIGIVGDLKNEGIKMIATGEMGIGNTTTSTALLCALTGADPCDLTGRGAGLSDEGFERKKRVIKESLILHGLLNKRAEVTQEYAFNALCSVGGFDLAGLAGVFIGCGMYRIPAVIDGLISATAALAAHYIVRGCEGYMIASHKGKERGSELALETLNKKGIIDADMALGEGTGAVMIFPLIDMAMALYDSGTHFDEAYIEKYERLGK